MSVCVCVCVCLCVYVCVCVCVLWEREIDVLKINSHHFPSDFKTQTGNPYVRKIVYVVNNSGNQH